MGSMDLSRACYVRVDADDAGAEQPMGRDHVGCPNSRREAIDRVAREPHGLRELAGRVPLVPDQTTRARDAGRRRFRIHFKAELRRLDA